MLKRTNQAQQKEIKTLEREKRDLEIETAELQRRRAELERVIIRLRQEEKRLEVAVDVAESREDKRRGLI